MEVTKPYEFIGSGSMEVTKPCKHVSNLTFLNWESVVPEVPRTVGLPPAPWEVRGRQIRSKTLGFRSPPFPSLLAPIVP